MITRRHVTALVGIVCFVPACQPAAPTFSDEDEAAIRAASQSYVETALASDYNAWIELLADDAVFMPPNETRHEGRDDIFTWVNTFPETTSLTVTPAEIEGLGDLAFVRGAYTLTVVMPESGPMSDRGNYIEIWQRQADGSWRIFRDIWNSDQPM